MIVLLYLLFGVYGCFDYILELDNNLHLGPNDYWARNVSSTYQAICACMENCGAKDIGDIQDSIYGIDDNVTRTKR